MVAERWDGPRHDMSAPRRHSADTTRKIRELEALGATMSPNIPADVIDRIHAYEFGPKTTDLEQLAERGIVVPRAETLGDEMLAVQLDRMIRGLADLGVFLTGTNHLSDRALYRRLEEDILRTPHGPTECGHGWTVIDLLGDREGDCEDDDGDGDGDEDPYGDDSPGIGFDRDRTLPRPMP